METLSKEEWIKRYADRIQERSGESRKIAEEIAETSWVDVEKDMHAFPQYGQDAPEYCADEEMSCWGD